MAKKNAFLAKLQAQAQAKEAVKTEAHVEIDTIALLLSAHDVCKVGSGRASKVGIRFLHTKWKLLKRSRKNWTRTNPKRKKSSLCAGIWQRT